MRTLISAGAASLLLIASPASAQTVERIAPSAEGEVTARAAVLDHCFSQVHGKPLVELDIDVAGAGWSDVSALQTTEDLRLFAPRSHASGVLVDVSPGNATCWVQATSLTEASLADRLVADLVAAGAQMVDDTTRDDGRVRIYAIPGPTPGPVPIVAIVTHVGPMARVLTVVVAKGDQTGS